MAASTDISTIHLPSRLDSANSPDVEASILAEIRPGRRLIVDGSEVTYMSAAGVRMLATILHNAQETDARIVFCRFSGVAADCLVVSGFSELLDVADTVDAAAKRLSSSRFANSPEDRLRPRSAAG